MKNNTLQTEITSIMKKLDGCLIDMVKIKYSHSLNSKQLMDLDYSIYSLFECMGSWECFFDKEGE